MSQVCYYTCTLVPPALIERCGYVPRAVLAGRPNAGSGRSRSGFEPSILPHANTCPYVVSTLAAAEQGLAEDRDAVLVVPSGCDAMRRAGDALRAFHPDRVFTYMVPRGPDPDSVRALAQDLDRLTGWLGEKAAASATPVQAEVVVAGGLSAQTREIPVPTGGPTENGAPTAVTIAEDGASAAGNGDCSGGTFAYPSQPRPGGVFVIGGPMSGPTLLEALERLGTPVSGAETCRGPECAARLSRIAGPEQDSAAIAEALLSQATCPRMSTRARRDLVERRLDETGAAAVVYARLPFCDPGVYDADAVRTIAADMGLPFLEVEIGYPLEVDGRLLVRLEAFVETLTLADSRNGVADDLFDDDLFDDALEADPPSHSEAAASPAGSGRHGRTDTNALLAGSFARRALAAKTRVSAFRSGTARRHLEHYALGASLDLYKTGAFVPWVSYLFPPEILASYGLTPLIPEVAATTLAGTDFARELEEAMNRQYLGRDICSYHRAAKAALEAGLLPAPTICLGTTPLCLGKECMLDAIATDFDVPFRSIRVPLPPDEGPACPADIQDVADQLRSVHRYLGELTGRASRLDTAVDYSNRASTVWGEICDRRLSGDLVLDGRRAFAFTFLGQVVWGSEGGAKGFERLLTQRGRADLVIGSDGNGGSGIEADGASRNGGPRPRILWMHTMPHQDPTLFDLIRAAGGAVVFEEMARVHLEPLDPRDPFSGMARRLIEHPLWGSGVRRARNAVDLAARGRIDGVVHFNHWGCRHGLGTLPVLRSALRAAGVPFLALDGDALDRPGAGAEGTVKQLESFLEML